MPPDRVRHDDPRPDNRLVGQVGQCHRCPPGQAMPNRQCHHPAVGAHLGGPQPVVAHRQPEETGVDRAGGEQVQLLGQGRHGDQLQPDARYRLFHRRHDIDGELGRRVRLTYQPQPAGLPPGDRPDLLDQRVDVRQHRQPAGDESLPGRGEQHPA